MGVGMIRSSVLLSGLAIVALLPAACTDSQSNPVAVNRAGSPSLNRAHEGDARSPSLNQDLEGDDDDGHSLRLVSVIGPGQGRIRATRIPHPTTPGNFAVHIEIRIRHAKPNTAYVGQRAAEVFAPPGAPAGFNVATLTDGSCQRGLAIAPWSTLVPPAAAFSTFPDQAHGLPALIINTDGHGNGEADFVVVFAFPLPLFDVTFRVIENSPAPTSVLQSDCTFLPLL
jgi:hypothetical protein